MGLFHDLMVAAGFQTGAGAGVDQYGNLRAAPLGSGLAIADGGTGALGRMGRGLLAGGTLVVANTTVTAKSRAYLTHEGDGGHIGILTCAASDNVPGVSFTVKSTNGADVGHFRYMLVESI